MNFVDLFRNNMVPVTKFTQLFLFFHSGSKYTHESLCTHKWIMCSAKTENNLLNWISYFTCLITILESFMNDSKVSFEEFSFTFSLFHGCGIPFLYSCYSENWNQNDYHHDAA